MQKKAADLQASDRQIMYVIRWVTISETTPFCSTTSVLYRNTVRRQQERERSFAADPGGMMLRNERALVFVLQAAYSYVL